MMLLLFLLLGGPIIEGNLLSFEGQWPGGQIQWQGGVLVLQGRDEVFLIEGDRQISVPFNGYPRCVLLHRDRLFVVTHDETAVHELATGEPVRTHEPVNFLGTVDKELYTLAFGQTGFDHPDLLHFLDPDTLALSRSLFKQPALDKQPTRAWVVRRKEDLFIALDNRPGEIFISTEVTRNRDSEVSRSIPGVSFRKKVGDRAPRTPPPLTTQEERPFQWFQEYLAESRQILFFGALERGYLLVTEEGVAVPDLNKDLYIGSQLNLVILGPDLEVVRELTVTGQFAGLEDNAVILVHDGVPAPSPLEVFASLSGSPEERARAMLSSFKKYEIRKIEPILYELDLTEIAASME